MIVAPAKAGAAGEGRGRRRWRNTASDPGLRQGDGF